MDEFLREIIGGWSYLGLFCVLMAAGFGLPLPEDIPLVLSGFVVSTGEAKLPLMIFFGLAGVILGDSALFILGRRYGESIMEHRLFRRIAKPWLVEKARQKYEHHGAKILFASRFMPGLRSVMFMTAGTFRIPYWKLLAFDGSAALISVPTLIYAGYKFHDNIDKVFANAQIASWVVGGLIASMLIAWGLWEYYHNLRQKREKTQDVAGDCAEVLEDASVKLHSGAASSLLSDNSVAIEDTVERDATEAPGVVVTRSHADDAQ